MQCHEHYSPKNGPKLLANCSVEKWQHDTHTVANDVVMNLIKGGTNQCLRFPSSIDDETDHWGGKNLGGKVTIKTRPPKTLT